MSKFTTLNLTSRFNIGREPNGWHPDVGHMLNDLPDGQQTFRGIPFELGPAEGKCWLALDRGRDHETIPLSAMARFVLFAHFCDVSHEPGGRQQPADYVAGEITRPGE